MAVRADGSSPIITMWRLRRSLLTFVSITVAGLLLLFLIARRVLTAIGVLFVKDQVTRMASVELWVVLTTLLLVIRFLLDFFGPWDANRSMTFIVNTIETLNYSMVQYTIGLMQLSAKRTNEYFQVWAVLLVTLQYSFKIGRPNSRSKQNPLQFCLDLMSSFWTANLLRVQTFFLLRIPLWLIWALNATRIISYFSSTDKAEGINEESNRFVADYMRYEHELGSSSQLSADADIDMKLYKYVILGEDQLLRDVQHPALAPVSAVQNQQEHPRRIRRVVRFDPKDYKQLITVDKIWDFDSGDSSRLLGGMVGQINQPNEMSQMGKLISFLKNFWENGFLAFASCRPDQLKDVCLSFALFKLLRRRFYDLPVHEARLLMPREKIRGLIFKYVLRDVERAFRIAAIELSFLQDLFYSKHATLFANGFPAVNMVLSLMLVGAMGYLAHPVRYIPDRMDQTDRNRITHGVFISRAIIFLIAFKELAEIYMYVFSQWTKVLLLCSYVKYRCMRHWLVEKVMRVALCFMNRGMWDESIRQHNLLISTRMVKIGNRIFIGSKWPTLIKLENCTKKAIFNSLKKLGTRLEMEMELEMKQEMVLEMEMELEMKQETELEKKLGRLNYISSASEGPSLVSQFNWTLDFEADTHTIIVWHIATCLCEVELASEEERKFRPISLPPKPFIKKPVGNKGELSTEDDGTAKCWEHYITAASLSNYCMYLVTKALVPDNGIVAKNVFREVSREINSITLQDSIRSRFRHTSMQDVRDRLMNLANKTDEDRETPDEGESNIEASMATDDDVGDDVGDDDLDIGNSLTMHGARLAKQLMDEFGEDNAGRLWEQLADFWTGFLLYLAAFTRASKHLGGRRELTTHLWALLSHSGFPGNAPHGHTFLEIEELETVNSVN